MCCSVSQIFVLSCHCKVAEDLLEKFDPVFCEKKIFLFFCPFCLIERDLFIKAVLARRVIEFSSNRLIQGLNFVLFCSFDSHALPQVLLGRGSVSAFPCLAAVPQS